MAITSKRHIYASVNVIEVDLDLASVAAHTTAAQNLDVPGLRGKILDLIEPSDIDGHLTIESYSNPRTGILTLLVTNADGSAVDDSSKRYILIVTP